MQGFLLPMKTRSNFLIFLFSLLLVTRVSNANSACRDFYKEKYSTTINLGLLRSGKVETGFDPLVKSFDIMSPHTIKNINEYTIDNMGIELLSWVKDGKSVLVIEGDGEEVKAQLQRAGWSISKYFSHSVGFHDIINIKKDNQEYAAVVRINGVDRVLHIQSFLKMMGAKESQVTTFRGYRSWKKEYLEVFKTMQKPPDLVVYGLTVHATTVLGSLKPNIFSRLEWLTIKAKMAFDDIREKYRKERFAGDISLRPMRVVTLSSGKTIWLVSPLYGEMVKDMISALAEFGAKNVLFLGTAGGIDPALKVGDWINPKEVAHVHVETPNFENTIWLQEQNHKKNQIVDVEYTHARTEARKYPQLNFESQLLISDVLQGANHTDLHATSSVGRISGIREGLRAILSKKLEEIGLGRNRFRWVKSYYFARERDLNGLQEIALKAANELGFSRVAPGVFDRQKVVSGRIESQYLSVRLEDIQKDSIRFQGKVVTGPRSFDVAEKETMYKQTMIVNYNEPPAKIIENLIVLARKNNAGELSLEVNPNVLGVFRFEAKFISDEYRKEFKDAADRLDHNQQTVSVRSLQLSDKLTELERMRAQLNELKERVSVPSADRYPINRELPPFPTNFYKKIHDALTNPNVFVDFLKELEIETFRKNPSPVLQDYVDVLLKMNEEIGFYGKPLDADRFLSTKEFRALVSQGRLFHDSMSRTRAHGEFTHMVHMAIIRKILLASGVPNPGPSFFQAVTKDKKMRMWSELFDSLEEHPLNFRNPEVVALYLRTFFMVD